MAFKTTNKNEVSADDDFEFAPWTAVKEQEAQEEAAANQLPSQPGEFLKFTTNVVTFIRIMPPHNGALWVDDVSHMFTQSSTGKFVKFACPNRVDKQRCAACEQSAFLTKHGAFGSKEKDMGFALALKLQKITLAVDLNDPSAGVRKLALTPRKTKGGGLFELLSGFSAANVAYWAPEGVAGKSGLVLPVLKKGVGMQISYEFRVPLSRMPVVNVTDIGKYRYEIDETNRAKPVVREIPIASKGIRTAKEWVRDYFDLSTKPYVPTYEETEAYVRGEALPEQRTMQNEMNNASRGPAPDLRKFEDDDDVVDGKHDKYGVVY